MMRDIQLFVITTLADMDLCAPSRDCGKDFLT